MPRSVILALLSLAFAKLVGAEATGVKVNSEDGRVIYAAHTEVPSYPYELRARHVQGAGIFQLHIRADGTVSSVDTLKSTGNAVLDQCARSAYLKWRFRPPGSATKVKVPITFSMPR